METIDLRPIEGYRAIGLGLLEPDPPVARPIASLPARYSYEPRNLPLRMTVVGGVYLALSAYLLIDDPMANFLAVFGVVGFGVLLLLGLAVISRRFVGPRELELREDGILLPAGFLWLKTVLVPFADVLTIRERTKALELMTRSHRTYRVSDDLLPSLEVFEDIKAFLKGRIGNPSS